MSDPNKPHQPIEGTHLFDGDAAAKGFALNEMCYSFNDAANRQAFRDDEEAYCAKFNLTAEQQHLLPRQAGGHFLPERAGCRLDADRRFG